MQKTHRFDYFHIHVEKAHLEVLKMKAAEIPSLISPASRVKYHATNDHEGSLIGTSVTVLFVIFFKLFL